jgi:rsbT antagonist protein RsbS
MARVPIISIGDVLIASIQEEIYDRDALALQAELGDMLEATQAGGVLLDVSVVETLDSFLGRLLAEIAIGARLLGAQTVIVGIQPAVALTLVELGLELKHVRTALNAERGMALLRRLMDAELRSDSVARR